MPIKRRGFVKSVLLAPAAPALLNAQQAPQQGATQQQPVPQPNTPAVQVPRQPQAIPLLKVTQPDLTAEPAPHFFNADQYAALTKLGEILVPPLKTNPGALDAHAPEFLDFLLSISPADRQKSYRTGLDGLNAQAKLKFHKPFTALDSTQADSILRPLLTVRPWPEDLPHDPMKKFIAQVHEDLRTATTNSREWVEASAKSGRRFTRGARSSGLYWKPIDPIVGGN